MSNQNPKRDDERIDRIAAGFRNLDVPPVPVRLFEDDGKKNIVASKETTARTVTWSIGIVAVMIAIVVVASMVLSMPDDSEIPNVEQAGSTTDNIQDQSEVRVQKLAAFHPFDELENEIHGMKSEIEQLKVKAESLDAIRKIDALLAKN